jgi:hypothetical protein
MNLYEVAPFALKLTSEMIMNAARALSTDRA